MSKKAYHANAVMWSQAYGTVYIRATLNHEPDRDVWVTLRPEFVASIRENTK